MVVVKSKVVAVHKNDVAIAVSFHGWLLRRREYWFPGNDGNLDITQATTTARGVLLTPMLLTQLTTGEVMGKQTGSHSKAAIHRHFAARVTPIKRDSRTHYWYFHECFFGPSDC